MKEMERKLKLLFVNGSGLFCVTPTSPPDGSRAPKATDQEPTPAPKIKLDAGVFCEQLINSFLVAAFTGLSTFGAGTDGDVSGKAAGIAFGLTFIVELRKYRKI